MWRVSLEKSAGIRSVAEWGTFVGSGFPCPGRGFGWVGAVQVGGVGWCIRAALGLVCLARFGRSRSLGLGWPGLCSGWWGFWGYDMFFCFAVGWMAVPLFGTPDISTLFSIVQYSKYSTL